MPSSPKIPREMILKESLNLLIEVGWNNVNIKTIAKKIGCSTQPISWHFENMDGLRSQLSVYALDYANSLMEPKPDDPNPFGSVGRAYIDIAYDRPNLFKFLYLDGGSKYSLGGLKEINSDVGNEELAKMIASKYRLNIEDALLYLKDAIVYTHGLLSFVVCDYHFSGRAVQS